jgi:hypothetical protein
MDWLDRSWRLYVNLPVRPACLKRDRRVPPPPDQLAPQPTGLPRIHALKRAARVSSARACVIAIAVEVLKTGLFDS